MSAVKKSAKISLYIFSFFVFVVVAGLGYIYVNMDSLAKQVSEKIATQTLGVPVRIGDMKISLEEKKVVVSDISIANPNGYKKEEAIHVDAVTIAAESFSKELLTFARVEVEGTNVNLEVSQNGTNLTDIKKNIKVAQKEPQGTENAVKKDEQIKVIIRKFTLKKAQLNPSVTLLKRDLAFITVPDVNVTGVGEKQNGVVAQEAIAQIVKPVLQAFSKSANKAGFLEGLSLETLNNIGLSTADVFKKNLKKSFDKDIKQLKGLFE